MSKHTPGPWYQVGAWVEVEDDDTPDICTCSPQAMEQDHLKWDWKTIHANARLIAAAPDMLVALQAYVADCESVDPEGLFAGETLIAARAAIAKATGGAK
jgi:hypothetical protein